MDRFPPLATIVALVTLATGVLLYGSAPGWLITVTGFLFVIGGTLLATLISEGRERTEATLRGVSQLFRGTPATGNLEQERFLLASEAFRRGRIRQADRLLQAIEDPFLRRGAQLIVDGCGREELERGLQWRIARVREQEKRQLRVMQAMSGFAPAFGMLGTLLGLVRMLFGLGDNGLEVVGSTMGFAMITTVYGLVAANLAIRPVISRMEQRARDRLAGLHIRHELLRMMLARENAPLIRESLQGLGIGSGEPEDQAQPAPRAGVRLVGA